MNSNYLKDCKRLMLEYNYDKNDTIDLENLTLGSSKKIWWVCDKGHEWQATVSNRNLGTNCPYCSNKKILIGYNDFKTLCPNLLKEWNYKKNSINPDKIGIGTAKKVWWVCDKGHEWEEEIRRRVQGLGCPYCSGHRIFIGYNDIATTNPELLKEWNYKRNNDTSPQKVSKGSSKKVWWVCDKGHEWQATIEKRVNGRNCPICNSSRQTSFAEQAIFYYLKQKYDDTINRYKDIFNNGMEIDVFIPQKLLGIEYDGAFFHNSSKAKEREKLKFKICKKKGIKLVRVKEDLASNSNCDYVIETKWNGNNYDQLDVTIKKIFNLLNTSININSHRDRIKIMGFYKHETHIKNGIASKRLLNEWNYEKNGILKPSMFTSGSGVKVWWMCDKGHEWEESISKRSKGNNCPYCSNHRVIAGYNDFASTNPKLLAEWNYKKNNKLLPSDISAGSAKKVWWVCDKGHEWQATIEKRVNGKNCPYCSNKKVLVGYNDFASTNPKLLAEWNYKKNKGIDPTKIYCKAGKKVWWKCSKCGFEWFSTIRVRTEKHCGCPHCAYNNIKNLKSKKTIQLSMDGKFIATYNSAKEARNATGIFHIEDVCNKKRATAGGFKWKYENEN